MKSSIRIVDVDRLETWSKYKAGMCESCAANCCTMPLEVRLPDLVRLELVDPFEVENIERHLLMGKTPLQAATDAAAEIGLAVVATTFTLIAVFLPIGLVGGQAGQMFRPFALTVTIALLASLKGTIDCVTAFSETDFRGDLQKVDVPALVIHGSNDQIVPFESTGKLAAEMIKNATLKVYDNAPHGFALTHQDQLNEDLLAFVKSL